MTQDRAVGVSAPARAFWRGGWRGKRALEMLKAACGAERFPKAAPLDVIASWGKAVRPVGAREPAVGAVGSLEHRLGAGLGGAGGKSHP